jgi:hypothetical protein
VPQSAVASEATLSSEAAGRAAGSDRLAVIPELQHEQPTRKATADAAAAAGPGHRVSPQDGQDGSSSGGCAGHAAMEAKITALMSEWGFADRATAEAYYRCGAVGKCRPRHSNVCPTEFGQQRC